MKLNVAQRMEEFQPGIFNVLDERRQQRLAQGLPVYNLSIGTPDFLPEPHVVQALAQAASEPANYRYSLTELPELVEAVQRWYLRRYGVELEPEELMSIYGSQEGLTHIGWALCDPGDVVLVPDPGYPIFGIGPSLAGAELRPMGCDAACYLMPWGSDREENAARYANSAYDTLLGVIAGAADEMARLGCLHDAEVLLLEDAALAPLYSEVTAWELRDGLTGVCRDGRGWFSFASVVRLSA